MGEIGIALPNHGREHNLIIRKIDPKEDIYSYSPYKKKHNLMKKNTIYIR